MSEVSLNSVNKQNEAALRSASIKFKGEIKDFRENSFRAQKHSQWRTQRVPRWRQSCPWLQEAAEEMEEKNDGVAKRLSLYQRRRRKWWRADVSIEAVLDTLLPDSFCPTKVWLSCLMLAALALLTCWPWFPVCPSFVPVWLRSCWGFMLFKYFFCMFHYRLASYYKIGPIIKKITQEYWLTAHLNMIDCTNRTTGNSWLSVNE